MKTAVLFLVVAVYGTSALPTLAWMQSTAQKAITKTHDVNEQTVQLVDSTNQAVADYVKDGSQTGTLWLQDGLDKLGDKTKDAIDIAQDKTNEMLDIMGQFGGPLKWGAAIGSKVTNMAANAGKTMTNVGVGTTQLSTAMGNQAVGAISDTAGGLSAGVAGKVTAVNDISAQLASAGVNKVVKVTSTIGQGIGNAIEAVGKDIHGWFKVPSQEKPAVQVPTAEDNINVKV